MFAIFLRAVAPSNRRDDITWPLLCSELLLVKKHSYVRNGHLTAGLERFLFPEVSAVLHAQYKQQLQHARTEPNADALWQRILTLPRPHPEP